MWIQPAKGYYERAFKSRKKPQEVMKFLIKPPKLLLKLLPKRTKVSPFCFNF